MSAKIYRNIIELRIIELQPFTDAVVTACDNNVYLRHTSAMINEFFIALNHPFQEISDCQCHINRFHKINRIIKRNGLLKTRHNINQEINQLLQSINYYSEIQAMADIARQQVILLNAEIDKLIQDNDKNLYQVEQSVQKSIVLELCCITLERKVNEYQAKYIQIHMLRTQKDMINIRLQQLLN
jgi:hypothetical protein